MNLSPASSCLAVKAMIALLRSRGFAANSVDTSHDRAGFNDAEPAEAERDPRDAGPLID